MLGRVLVWDGGEHNFRLGIGELRALQQATGVGPTFLMGRVISSQWFVDDLIETVRLGLIGGGMSEVEAKRLTNKVFEHTDALQRHVVLAATLLKDTLTGQGEFTPSGETTAPTMTNEENPTSS